MKTKTLLALAVIAVLASSVAFGQSISGIEVKDVSARLDGMSPDFAGLINDEYTDIWIAPYDILNVKGGRLYTSLSNYITGEERQFGDSGSQSSADEYLIGSVYSWENIGTFGLFFRNSYFKTQETDVSSGGASDPVTVRTSADTFKEFAIPVFYGRKISDQLSFGIKLAYLKDDSNSSSSVEFADTPTSAFNLLSESASEDNFHYWTITPGVKFEVNPDWAVGVSAEVGQAKERFTSLDGSFGEGTSEDIEAADLKGTSWGFAVQSWYRVSDAMKLRGFISYSNMPLKGDDTFTSIVDTTVTVEAAANFEEKDRVLGVGIGSEIKLNEKLMLALGIKYLNEKFDISQTSGVNTIEVQKDDDHDSALILPVGLEYTMTDWLTFRIGASHRIMTDKDSDSDTFLSSTGTVIDRTSTETKDTSSETTYYYGAGLNITENLTVDLLGWRNLTDLNNWKLSATVKF